MTNSDFLKRFSELSPKRQALLALELQNRLDATEQQGHEPIAVIAMGCRFPGGVNTPEAYWELLLNGVDAIGEVPPDRWDVDAFYDPDPDIPGKVATRWGGFLNDVDQFDPQLFGISPREAVTMDPQQRLLLEVCWEVLERAGYAPDQLNGARAGVFVGVCNGDYYHLVTAAGGDQVDMYLATGSAHSVASGRIAYVFGLQGPAVSVDTACSSSLVALHMAVRSLRAGECEFALAGGVNLVLALDTTRALSRAGMMASDGRCKAFDASADGFVRSEGCGMVLLKPLSAALADRDPIIAVIRGTAVNQDGRSNGLTAPNGPSQESVIRAALADAKLPPADVSYVETHGTGTSLGDPIEVQALGAAYGTERDRPLLIGSVKTNLGHMESAAGVGGFMKLALVLQHGFVPPHLHLAEPNPYIAWDQLPVTVPVDGVPLPAPDGRRIGAVSSFGFSGTNAHMILEAAALSVTPPPDERPAYLLPLSAHTENALREAAALWENRLAEGDLSLADAAHTAGVGRAQLAYRLALRAADADDARAKLAAYRGGESADGLLVAPARDTRRRKLAFLFTGQGSQQAQMGRQLYETQPVFREAINRCDALAGPYLDVPLLSILYPGADESSPIHEIAYAQPAQFAVEYALGVLWQSWGIEPSAVAGHSIGEYAAACLAGVFSLEDALKLVTTRGRLMQSTAAGEMAAVFANEAMVQAALVPFGAKVSVAALNAPEITVISGEKAAVAGVIEALKQQRIRAKRLEVSIAAHSPMMDGILNAFAQVAAGITYHAPGVDFYSGLTGNLVKAQEIASPDYWVRHLRQTVRFAPVMESLHANGYRFFVEIGPAPDLLNMAQRTLPAEGSVYLPSLRPGTDDWQQMLGSLGTLFVHGINVDWRGLDRPYRPRRLALPTYPFQRERYWFRQTAAHAPARTAAGEHPLLGERLRSAAMTDIVFQTGLSANWPPFLNHHRIYDVVILPSPAFIEMALKAAEQAFGGSQAYSVTALTIHEALVLPEDRLSTVQIILSRDGGGARFQILGLGEDGESWKLHASGGLVPVAAVSEAAAVFTPDDIQARCSQTMDGATYYERLRALGLEFGSSFQGVRHVWRRDGEALGEIVLPAELTSEFGQYLFHPALLDSCFHLLGAPLPDDLETAYLLIGIDAFRRYRTPGRRLWNHTVLNEVSGETFTGSVRLYDEDGMLVAEATGLHLKRAGRETLMRAVRRRPDDWFYNVVWEPRPHAEWADDGADAGFESATTIAAAARDTAGAWALPADFDAYVPLAASLQDISAAFIVEALRGNGVEFFNGRLLQPEDLSAEQDYHRDRLASRLFQLLVDRGLLSREASGWRVIGQPPIAELALALARLAQQYPAYEAEIELVARCGPALAGVLRGAIDPLALLFPDGSFEELERVYGGSPVAQGYSRLLREAVAQALRLRSSDHPLRVLEIGAGTGATTASVIDLLAGEGQYLFTDLSPLFLERAQAKFAAHRNMRFGLLNIEEDPLQQGYAEAGYDLVIAANVLHATRDLRETVEHTSRLLAPGGLLVLLEGTRPEAWIDITFGLTEGWWRFADRDRRPDYPLVTADAWLELLSQTGYAGGAPLRLGDASGQTVIVAQKAAGSASAATNRPVEWLVFADQSDFGRQLVHGFAAHHQGAALALLGTPNRHNGTAAAWTMADGEPETFGQLLAEPALANLRGVLYLAGFAASPEQTIAHAAEADSTALLSLAQAAARISDRRPPSLWVVTAGAQPADGNVSNPAQAALWGLGRVIALEHPEWWGGLIDLDPDAPRVEDVCREVTAPDGEDQTAYRLGQRLVARLARVRSTRPEAIRLAPDASYLITGGLGGLGLNLAVWMAENGARHLTLLGRSPLPERSLWDSLPDGSDIRRRVEGIQALEALGVQVNAACGDVGNVEQMAPLLARFGEDLPRLRGIIHAAAALSNWPVADMPRDALASQFGAKVGGAVVLDHLAGDLDLDFLVAFSSTTALWGVRELGHYAAANAFLDAFAHHQRARGMAAYSINWGTWETMRAASAEERAAVAQYGLKPMAVEQALGVLGDILAASAPAQLTVAAVDWSLLKPAYEARRRRPLLEHVGAIPAQEAPTAAADGTPPLLAQLEAASPEEHPSLILRHVSGLAGAVLGAPRPDMLDVHQGLFEMGMDSLMSVELKTRLEKSVGRSLPSTLTFNYPTIAELAEYLETLLFSDAAEPALEAPPEAPVSISALDVDDLSEDELAEMLLKKLKGLP